VRQMVAAAQEEIKTSDWCAPSSAILPPTVREFLKQGAGRGMLQAQ